MATPPAWAYKALMALTGLTLLLLLVQYLLGLWTADYAPASFNSNTSYPSLDWHYNIGFALGFVTIALMIVAAFTRELRLIGPSVVVFVAVLIAALSGGQFVSTTPNDPVDSFSMGFFFLVAFGAAMGLSFQLRRRWSRPDPVPMAGPATPSG